MNSSRHSISLTRRHALQAALGMSFTSPLLHAQEPPVVIGMSVGQGAASESRGVRVLAGASTYIERINASGGLRGRPIELVTLDDDGIPARHSQNLRTLVEQRGAIGILGCVGDAVCQASGTAAAALGVPLVAPLTGISSLSRQSNPWVFRLRPDYHKEADALAVQLRGMACLDVALLFEGQETDESTQALRSALARQGLKVEPVRWRPESAQTIDAALAQVGKPNRQAVVLNLGLTSIEDIISKQLSERTEWPRTVAAISVGHPAALLPGFKRQTVIFTSVVPNPEVLSKSLAREFNQDADKYGSPYAVTFDGLEAYLGARLIVEALRRVAPGRRLSASALREALESADSWSLSGFRLSFAPGRASGSDWVDVAMRSRNGTLLN